MQTYQIVPMTSEHSDAVLELWNMIEGVSLTDADTVLGLRSYFERNPGMSHVALHDAKIIGAALCGHDGRRGYLHHLAVAEEHRGQGIGRAIVDACLNELGAIGIKRCNLFIFDDNQEARRFWTNDEWLEWKEIRLLQKELDE